VSAFPRPPLRLARRVGELDPAEPWRHWDEVGAMVRGLIDGGLPLDWDWDGRRALDFGCGAGRVLARFADEAERAELWGCDIDRPSIDWLEDHLAPPFRPFLVDEHPRLPQVDGFFDLIWAASVFTHLTDGWAAWLAELHRTLADGGLLMASVLGPGMWNAIAAGAWQEDRTGMCVLRAGQPWSVGGPTVFHSEWWIREHWGRAFEIVSLDPGREPWHHGWVVLRKRSGIASAAELDRIGQDPREVEALRHNLELLHAEDRRLRPRFVKLTGRQQVIAARWWLRRMRARVGG
jgi:SAM-dependent methyltransferase